MNGILLIDKPSGMTSHDVVDIVRKKLSIRKVGHAGTLDPMATGLLVVLVGNATKKSDDFMNSDKYYRAQVLFGTVTDTGDLDGRVLEKRECSIKKEEILDIVKKFRGDMMQIPPMFSAKKHKGKKLYEYARIGLEVKRLPEKITIKKLELTSFNGSEAVFEIWCSKGTYIRQLAVDMGEALGTGACLAALRRLESGVFSVDRAMSLEHFKTIPIEKLYENFARI